LKEGSIPDDFAEGGAPRVGVAAHAAVKRSDRP
jgi:hypothetical protein